MVARPFSDVGGSAKSLASACGGGGGGGETKGKTGGNPPPGTSPGCGGGGSEGIGVCFGKAVLSTVVVAGVIGFLRSNGLFSVRPISIHIFRIQ